jgi:hypothetical protein
MSVVDMEKLDMEKRGVDARWAALGLAVLFIGTGSLSLSGQEFRRLSIPLPVEIDAKPTRSKLYLKVEMKTINQPFDQFAAGHPDKEEAMFVKAVQAVRKNDVAGFGSVWTAPDEMKNRGQTKVAMMSNNTPDGWMKVIRDMFDFDKLTVVAEVLAGPDTVFIWDSQTKNGVLRRALYVGADKNGKPRLSAVGGANPVDDLLQNAFVAAQSDPDYKPLPNINLRYQYPVPLEGAGLGQHPVFLVFDGLPMDFPVTNEKVEAPSPLLKFYRAATLAQRDSMTEQFAASFTSKSAEKVKEWQAAKTEFEKQHKSEQKSKPPNPAAATGPATAALDEKALTKVRSYVKFVMNADPLYLVFQAPGQGNNWKPGDLSYAYLVSESGSYKQANFGYGNTLDQLLQNPGLFDKQALKPAPAKPGAPKPKVQPAPAKPAGAKH